MFINFIKKLFMKKPFIVPPSKSEAEQVYNELEVDTLARTLWGEARGEGERGMAAVACTILNRVKVAQAKGKYWWGQNIIQVCQRPYQFSCWNRSDPNFPKLIKVDDTDFKFALALAVARKAVVGKLKDETGGATHYYADSIKAPYWTKGETITAKIGHHIFYRIVT